MPTTRSKTCINEPMDNNEFNAIPFVNLPALPPQPRRPQTRSQTHAARQAAILQAEKDAACDEYYQNLCENTNLLKEANDGPPPLIRMHAGEGDQHDWPSMINTEKRFLLNSASGVHARQTIASWLKRTKVFLLKVAFIKNHYPMPRHFIRRYVSLIIEAEDMLSEEYADI